MARLGRGGRCMRQRRFVALNFARTLIFFSSLTSTAAARAAKATLGTAAFLAGADAAAGRGVAEQRRESIEEGESRRQERKESVG